MRTIAILMCALAMTSCTSIQLESTTTSLAPSINRMELDQIYTNLAVYIDACRPGGACNALPSQFILGGGQTQVSNQIQSPNITANLTGRTISSLAFQNQNQWTQSWSITPVTDFSDLERLRCLYQLAVLLTDDSSNNTKLIESFIARYSNTQIKGMDPNTQQLAKLITGGALSGASNNGVTIDQAPLPLPVDSAGKFTAQSDAWRYPLANHKWVYWDVNTPPAGLIHAGKYGSHDIYVAAGPLQDFLMWISGATANSTGGTKAASSSSSKGASGLSINPIS